MTLAEFKAWFEGYTEDIGKAPTQKQWARVKERVAEIDGKATTERVYIDRYWPSYYPYWYNTPSQYRYTSTPTFLGASTAQTTSPGTAQANLRNGSFSPTQAMYALGKAEAVGVA